jgi:uncharacterized membrane protein
MSQAPAHPVPTLAPPRPDAAVARTRRLAAFDALRGLALALMALDHAMFFTRLSVQAEWNVGEPRVLPGTGWVITGLLTNFAAPTFWMLAGISLALMAEAGRRAGRPDANVTRFILWRAAILFALDLTVVPLAWELRRDFHFGYVFDLLSSVGVSMLMLAAVRRLPRAWIGAIGLAVLAGFQAAFRLLPPDAVRWPLAARMWVVYGYGHGTGVPFPVLAWAPLVLVGYAIGPAVTRPAFTRARTWGVVALLLALAWLAVRLAGGWGSPAPWRAGDPKLWFVVMSKGPPGLDFLLWNLAIGALLMAAVVATARDPERAPMRWLIRLGQAPLFVYAAHLVVYPVIGRLGLHALRYAPLARAAVVWLAGLALLVPGAAWWRGVKLRHAGTPLRYF